MMTQAEALENALGFIDAFLDHIDCDHNGDHPLRQDIVEFLEELNKELS